MTDNSEVIKRSIAMLSDDKIDRLNRKVTRRTMVATFALLAMLVVGIWVDWRWLLTALVPMTFVVYYGVIGPVVRSDLLRRIDEREAASGG